jgi:pyruvate dehydrogenase phosphatase
MCYGRDQLRMVKSWAKHVTSEGRLLSDNREDNLALRLLWLAAGAEDDRAVSKVLTLDTDTAWMDDTAIVVQTL